ncbi:NACHT domain-containing protein [Actinoplanes sp. NBRC 103695]|uniref:NACHT domain-containing protein n=1 Tax=Actinoplanes sp. NBRC 103695 TaxID=3032202 RepID=UPI0024A42F74|nr:NACHT domain-containing protein [Actinoplanes sp. NBRC 103695]GLY97972.1 hypothetical protein Acsp02_52260 [Actinoplanes sp. NBRC 103695]
MLFKNRTAPRPRWRWLWIVASGLLVLLVAGPLIDFSRAEGLTGLDQLGSVVGAIAGVLALVTTVVVAARRGPRSTTTVGRASDEELDAFARAITEVWEPSPANRTLTSRQHPLPSAWTTVLPPAADHWANVRKDGVDAPLDLDGVIDTGNDDALWRLATDERLCGRVVILGDPGAGKTALLLRLALGLLRSRESGHAVPLFLPLSTWNPEEHTLQQWIADQARTVYGFHGTIASDQILPIFDGLDEMQPGRRAGALDAICTMFPKERRLVLTSRTVEYQDTLEELRDHVVACAAVIELSPLDPVTVRDYLVYADAPADAARWKDVFARDDEDGGQVAAALSAPLWVSMARAGYRGAGPVDASPDELLGQPAVAIHGILLDRFLADAYGPSGPHAPSRWSGNAEGWLRNIAVSMRSADTHDLAWWELVRGVPEGVRTATGIGFGLFAGLAATVASQAAGIGGVFVVILIIALRAPLVSRASRSAAPATSPFGKRLVRVLASGVACAFLYVTGLPMALLFIVFGVAAGAIFGMRPPSASTRGRILRSSQQPALVRIGRVLAVGLVVALPIGSAFAVINRRAADDLPNTLGELTSFCLMFGFSLGLPVGIVAEFTTYLHEGDAGLTPAGSPDSALRSDCVRALATGPMLAILTGGSVWSVIQIALLAMRHLPLWKPAVPATLGFSAALQITLPGAVTTSLIVGVAYGLISSAWGWFQLARLHFAMREQLPWSIMAFLRDANQRAVLRQIGGIYQFRHAFLRDRLATPRLRGRAGP